MTSKSIPFISAISWTAFTASAGVFGMPGVASVKGPSVSVRILLRGISAKRRCALEDLRICELIENQQPILTARRASERLPENQCRTVLQREPFKCESIMDKINP